MFEIEIDRSFSAAHQLRGYNGDCCKLHGHNYKITVTVRSSELDEIGIALDFKKLKAELDALLAEYDHSQPLRACRFSGGQSDQRKPRAHHLPQDQRKDERRHHPGPPVRVGESDHSAVTYFED